MDAQTLASPPPLPVIAEGEKSGMLNAAPGWGSYLYQNFLLPAFSPNIASEWLNLNSPFASSTGTGLGLGVGLSFGSAAGGNVAANANNTANAAQNLDAQLPTQGLPDYFSQSWSAPPPMKTEPVDTSAIPRQQSIAGPSSFYPQPYYYNPISMSMPSGSRSNPSISTTLLMNAAPGADASASMSKSNTGSRSGYASGATLASASGSGSSSNIPPSVDVADHQMVQSPSPSIFDSAPHSLHHSPLGYHAHGVKRRADSLDSEPDHDQYHSHDEHDHEHYHDVPEGVERDGMIWGMKVEEYRALSARERKRVRNRISARTFRAKRKEHLSSLESDLGTKHLQVKLAQEETSALRRELAEVKRRLAKYEKV